MVRQRNACKAQAKECENGIDLRLSEEVRAEKLFGLFTFLAKVAVELFTGLWYNLRKQNERHIGICGGKFNV